MRSYEQKYIYMPIVPVVLPELVIQVTVSAFSFLDMDTQTLNIQLLVGGNTICMIIIMVD